MENTKNLIVASVLGIIVAFGAVAIASKPVNVTIEPAPVTVQPASALRLGASGPDISSPYFSYGDLIHWANKSTLVTATNTICLIQTPAATTTLNQFWVKLDTSSSSATQIILGKGSVQATTTALSGTFAVAANVQIMISASTTPSDANASRLQLAPNTWLVASMVASASSVGTVSPTGTCGFRAFQN